jgi:hypothetical protein
MKVEEMRRPVKRWEDDQKVVVTGIDRNSKMAKVICESRWNVAHECDANDTKKALKRHCQELPNEGRQLPCGLGRAPGTDLVTSRIGPSPVTRKLNSGRTASIAIVAITPNATIQPIGAITGRIGHA